MAEYTEYHPLKFWLDPASIAEIVAHIQTYLVNNPINSSTEIETIIHDYLIAHPEIIGGVRSINGETGEVVLTADNISGGENVTIKDVLDSLQDQIDDIVASIPSDYQQLINDVSDLKSAFNTGILPINKTLNWKSGYVGTNGKINTSQSSVFALVPMLAGEKVTVSTANSGIAIISKTSAESVAIGDTVTVIQTTASGNYETHTYTAPENMNIVLCVTASNYACSFTKKSNIILDLAGQINKMTTPGTNKFNSQTTVAGYIGSGIGNIIEGSSYFTSDYINVSEFVYGYAFTPSARKILFYDSYKQPIKASYHNDTTAAGVLSLNSDYKFMRLSWASNSTNVLVADAIQVPDYEPFEIVAADGVNYLNAETKTAVQALSKTDNNLYGKKWAVCGDSFTAGVDSGTIDSGKYAGEKIVYPYLIGNRTGINVLSFFLGGRTLAFPATPGSFVNSLTCPSQTFYYQSIPADVDYITIYLGINDEHHATGGGDDEDPTGIIPLGTINDNTTDTYYGAWNVVLSWLIENRPFAHIGIIITNGLSITGYRTAQLEIAKKYGIPYIDLNGDSRTPVMIRSINTDIASAVRTVVTRKQAVDYDGTRTGSVNLHPNNSAHEYESYFIEAFLRSI